MRALSLKQPWAELILQGRKKIEIRKWSTNFRGKFLIHSSKKPDEVGMKRFGFKELPLGFILGEAELVGVKKYNNEADFMKDVDEHLATLEWGNNGFILENVKRIKPIPANGKLNFWEADGIHSQENN
jgi:hypothetical protein